MKLDPTCPGSSAARDALRWLERQRAAAYLRVERIDFAESREWEWLNDRDTWVHRTRGFFSVAGLEVSEAGEHHGSLHLPIIDQPERGILGFLVRERDDELEFLAQAKAEPGNIDIVQVAPTVQATESNYRRLHGGSPQPFLDHFVEPAPGALILESLQSEQGTRFWGKRNRNMIVWAPQGGDLDHGPEFQWIGVRTLAELLLEDNVVNTDARSVLACLPLDVRAAGEPRAGESALRRDLRASLLATDDDAESSGASLLDWLEQARAASRCRRRFVPLHSLRDWKILGDRIENSRAHSVVQVKVESNVREVDRWDQPLIQSNGRALVQMLCQRRRGALHFLVRAAFEPGNPEYCECTTTIDCVPSTYGPEELEDREPLLGAGSAGQVLLEVMQSEEGGRFWRDETRYRLVQLEDGYPLSPTPEYRWMTLGQVLDLLRYPGVVTNPMRSLVSHLRLAVA